MESYLLDWINFLLRWTHVIVAIAWIGSSFYFVFLDSSLTPPLDEDLRAKGVDGELWAVHGGGFYNPQKYLVAPRHLPKHLHWFYWESYSTWLSGLALFTMLYLFQANTFLIDPRVHAWTAGAAIVASLAFLVVFWIGYDTICRVFEKRGGDRLIGVLVTVLVVFAAWLACHLFSGRAAFVLAGAMLATSMSANVFFWIIPGQRKVVALMAAGQPVDPALGKRAKQRSVHNTYFTLPVLVAMLSNHYGFLHGAADNWVVLVGLMAAGALIRHSFVARHRANVLGKRVPWEYAGVGVVILIALGAWLAPTTTPEAAAAGATSPGSPTVTGSGSSGVAGSAAAGATGTPGTAPGSAKTVHFAEVQAIVTQRCALCHNANFANKNVRLDIPAGILQHAPEIYQQAVVLKAMPMNNATQITDAERATLGQWFQSGARPD